MFVRAARKALRAVKLKPTKITPRNRRQVARFLELFEMRGKKLSRDFHLCLATLASVDHYAYTIEQDMGPTIESLRKFGRGEAVSVLRNHRIAFVQAALCASEFRLGDGGRALWPHS